MEELRNRLIFICSICLSFMVGYLGAYYTYVPKYTKQISILKEQINNKINNHIQKKEDVTIAYVPKEHIKDNDIEYETSNNIKIKYNDNIIDLQPINVDENYKFEKGKVQINKQEQYVFDLSKDVNDLAEEKAKKYKRYNTADYGILINKDSVYGGIRYNAKTFDVGYYHGIGNKDWLIGFHYKF